MQAAVATEIDREHMRRALELAERGRGKVSPNPLVGAVVAREGEVVAEGWHERLGELHAEAAALAAARAGGADVEGATMYVTLEPCAHHGRQPPCAEAVVEAGLARVVVGCDDPSAKASGRGPGMMRDEGVSVEFIDGPEAVAARALIQPFRKHARTGLPLVILKSAMTLDGRTATADGGSKWISGVASRQRVHRWRAESDLIAIGIGTALADDPTLTAREVGAERQPVRVVFDPKARLPLDSNLIRTVGEAELIVVTAPGAPTERVEALDAAGAQVITCDGEGPEHIAVALGELGRRGATSLFLEGGPTLAGAFRDAGEIDELRLFVAPALLGGEGARPLLGGEGAPSLPEAERALSLECERSGEDLLLTARMREW